MSNRIDFVSITLLPELKNLIEKSILLASVFFAFSLVVNAQSKADIPKVSVCELINKSADYDKKVVKIKALYHSGFEHSYISDSPCDKGVWESSKILWVELGNSLFTSSEPKILNKFKKALYGEPKSLFEEPYNEAEIKKWEKVKHLDWRVKVTFVGTFYKSDVPKFGHLNQYRFLFVPSKVEKAGKLKIV